MQLTRLQQAAQRVLARFDGSVYHADAAIVELRAAWHAERQAEPRPADPAPPPFVAAFRDEHLRIIAVRADGEVWTCDRTFEGGSRWVRFAGPPPAGGASCN